MSRKRSLHTLGRMKLKYKYKNVASKVLRPIIPIEVEKDGRSIYYEVLVDSGADHCVFNSEIATYLGIDLESGEEMSVTGITGSVEKCYAHEVNVKVGGHPYKVKTNFLKNMSKMGHGVVGQAGFFDKFIVKFDLAKAEIELSTRS